MTVWGTIEGTLFKDLTLDQIVWLHLNADPRLTKDMRVLSTLDEAESTMRHVNTNIHSQAYAPVLAAFAILDQIGGTYSDERRAAYTGVNTNILKALHYFGDTTLTADENDSLYMFRNGLMHDAAFTSQSRRGVWHIFRYDNEIARVIQLPARSWDGTVADVSDQTTTLINRTRLVDMISSAITELRGLFGTPDLKVHQTAEQIAVKYLLWRKRSPMPRGRQGAETERGR